MRPRAAGAAGRVLHTLQKMPRTFPDSGGPESLNCTPKTRLGQQAGYVFPVRSRVARGARGGVHDVPEMQQSRGSARLSNHADRLEKLPDTWAAGDRGERLLA